MKNFLLVLWITWPAFLAGQVDFFPCVKQNRDLLRIFRGDTLESLYVHDCHGPGMDYLSSSFLVPSGVSRPTTYTDEEEEMEAMNRYEMMSCRYAAGNLGDGDPGTAWVEGVEGQGIGEVVIVPCLDLKKPIRIWSGYGKSDALFHANSRPKTVRLCIIQGQYGGPTQYGTVWQKLVAIAENQVELLDTNSYQEMSVPGFEADSAYHPSFDRVLPYEYFLGLEVLDVYPGSKYEDTCISDITSMDK